VTVPTRYLPPADWPLPTGGWGELWREVRDADVVVANGTRQLLPILAIAAAWAQRKGRVAVVHGGETLVGGSFIYHRVLGSIFDQLLARPALRVSLTVSPSRSGIEGARKTYGVRPRAIPFPLRDLPPSGPAPTLTGAEPLRVVWVGRFFPEKDPLTAVEAVERLRRTREARLDLYGEGVLRTELDELARSRPWLRPHGSLEWEQVQLVMSRAHACLSSSSRDAAQLAVLEALCRGIPVVSTQVGDAPHYYVRDELKRFCVPPRDPGALAAALLALANSYDDARASFTANALNLVERHERQAAEALMRVVDSARRSSGAHRRRRRQALGA
jgi:glycosyltransferase involved in cell wall biosynthesis